MKTTIFLQATLAVTAALTLLAEPAPWDKYNIPEETLWQGAPLPLPDKQQDTLSFGSCPMWFMGTHCTQGHAHDNAHPFRESCPEWGSDVNNGLALIDEVQRLFPGTQFVLAGVFVPPREMPDFLRRVYAKGAFYQSQKAPVLDADALALAGPHPIGDQGKEVHTENWVIATTPNYQDFFRKKLLNTAKLGVNNFKQVDFVWPWDQRYGYDPITVDAFRADLKGADEGLRLRQADGSVKNIHFWDYFQFYRGLTFTPADLELASWDAFTPVKEAEVMTGAPTLAERRNLVVFFLLYHYEHLKQYQRFGRWAAEVGAMHEASVNPESLYNACDNIFITRLADFGTVYYEYFGSPINAEAAYLFMPSYRRDAEAVGRKIGLIKELGQGGHGRPHNLPIVEYIHNLDLTGNGFAFYHNEWEEGTFAQMKSTEFPYYHNRWLTWVAGAYGYKDARDLQLYRPQAKMLQVANRSGGFYTESWIWDAMARNTFGGDLLAAHADVESIFPAQFAEAADAYDTLFYTPLYTPATEIPALNAYLADGNRRVVTHSFIPYSRDRGVNYLSWEEPAHQVAHHALDNLQGADRWLLSPVFESLQHQPGEVTGTVRFGAQELGNATVPEYWQWQPEGVEVLATIGDKALISRLRDADNNEFIYWHVRLSKLDAKIRREAVRLMTEALALPTVAQAHPEAPAIVHAFRSRTNPAAHAAVMYNRTVLEKDGVVLGYRPQEDWLKNFYQYRADGFTAKADFQVDAPGRYLVYYYTADRVEEFDTKDGNRIPLELRDVFADVVWIVPDTPEGRAWLEERQARRGEMIDYLDFNPEAPMLPTDYLFTPGHATGYEFQN